MAGRRRETEEALRGARVAPEIADTVGRATPDTLQRTRGGIHIDPTVLPEPVPECIPPGELTGAEFQQAAAHTLVDGFHQLIGDRRMSALEHQKISAGIGLGYALSGNLPGMTDAARLLVHHLPKDDDGDGADKLAAAMLAMEREELENLP